MSPYRELKPQSFTWIGFETCYIPLLPPQWVYHQWWITLQDEQRNKCKL